MEGSRFELVADMLTMGAFEPAFNFYCAGPDDDAILWLFVNYYSSITPTSRELAMFTTLFSDSETFKHIYQEICVRLASTMRQ